MSRALFPRWTNATRPVVLAVLLIAPVYAGSLVFFGASPWSTDVGYQPIQPIPYSHALHAGELGIDCVYCHTTVEEASHAAIPPSATCMNCHSQIYAEPGNTQQSIEAYEKLRPLFETYAEGRPIEWVRIHDLPGYAYFNHSSHVYAGIGCETCHGRIDKMEVVYQAAPLSMAWCLECHRAPEEYIRPAERVTTMGYERALVDALDELRNSGGQLALPATLAVPTELELELQASARDGASVQDLRRQFGSYWVRVKNVQSEKFLTDCSTCHR